MREIKVIDSARPAKELFEMSRLKNSKPLFWLSVISFAAALILIPIRLLDEQTLDGAPVWDKPLKFFISTAIFALTYSWLSSFLVKGVRLVASAGWVILIGMTIELALITGVAATGRNSHFNVSTPLASTIWYTMAAFISIVLIATVVFTILILRDKSQKWELRLGLGLGSMNTAIGMALAFVMTSPTANQLANSQGIAGAHSVGVSDGGPGLPFLGWSIVAGDLRVGHFFGLHSIQVAAVLLAIAIALPLHFRTPLLVVGNMTYLGFIALVTLQALQAESFSSPSVSTITSFGILLAIAGALFIIWSQVIFRSKSKTNA